MKNELSTEVLAKETHQRAVGFYNISEDYAYKFILEIKKIRDDRYYKDLGHSNFDNYCMEAWGLEKTFVQERIKIASELGEGSGGYNHQYGHRKTLLLARMPEEGRANAVDQGIPTADGLKSIEEATQKEIREYQQKLKYLEVEKEGTEIQVSVLENDVKNLSKKLFEAENKPLPEPTIVEVERIVEIDNTNYTLVETLNSQVEELTRQNETSERRLAILQREVKLYKDDSEEYNKMKEEITKLTHEKDSIGRQMQEAGDIGKLAAHVENTLKIMSPYVYVVKDITNDVVLNALYAIIDKVTECLEDIENNAGRYDSHIVRDSDSMIIDAKIIN